MNQHDKEAVGMGGGRGADYCEIITGMPGTSGCVAKHIGCGPVLQQRMTRFGQC